MREGGWRVGGGLAEEGRRGGRWAVEGRWVERRPAAGGGAGGGGK